ncbi:hypothetical protein HAX54_053456, partial [Datura stramonium]|nr:hypothetical protein [Datura stramonium]
IEPSQPCGIDDQETILTLSETAIDPGPQSRSKPSEARSSKQRMEKIPTLLLTPTEIEKPQTPTSVPDSSLTSSTPNQEFSPTIPITPLYIQDEPPLLVNPTSEVSLEKEVGHSNEAMKDGLSIDLEKGKNEKKKIKLAKKKGKEFDKRCISGK